MTTLLENETGYNQDERRTLAISLKVVESLKKILEEDKAQKNPLFLKIKDDFIFKIARKAVNMKTPLLIGIAGESASGKTTLVKNTVNALIPEERQDIYTVIPCDNYYYDQSEDLRKAGNYENLFASGFSFDTPDAINLQLMKEHLLALKDGKSVLCPEYDFVTCESNINGSVKNPTRIIFNEGLYVLTEEFRDIMDIKVYVFTPFEILKTRWYSRAESRGKTGKAADLQFANVNQTAQLYIRPSLQISDVIINGLTSADYIKDITERIYFAIKEIVVNS